MGTGNSGLFSGTNGGGCFIAGTLVWTENGLAPIERIRCGDYVQAKNVGTGEKGLKRVVSTFVHLKNNLVAMSLNGTMIETTDAHPFWVDACGWICANSLENGDPLETYAGDPRRIGLIKRGARETETEVYNIEVEEWHTYYVSDLGVLVHNKPVRVVYNSIKESPNYPRGFRTARNGTTKNTVTNAHLVSDLRGIEPGAWKKVYKDGYDAQGNQVSIHYFESKSGRVAAVKVKQGWSNKTSE
jgi:hypothetical protein